MGIESFEDDASLRIDINNRKRFCQPRNLFYFFIMAIWGGIWIPSVAFMTIAFLTGRSPFFFSIIWLPFGYVGVLAVYFTYASLFSKEFVRVDADGIDVGAYGLLAMFNASYLKMRKPKIRCRVDSESDWASFGIRHQQGWKYYLLTQFGFYLDEDENREIANRLVQKAKELGWVLEFEDDRRKDQRKRKKT